MRVAIRRMPLVVVERRGENDFLAYREGNKKLWDFGTTPDEARGKFVATEEGQTGKGIEVTVGPISFRVFKR